MLAVSCALTVVIFLSLRMRPEALRPVKWRLAVWPRKILPVAVTLKRLRAPRCVFNFIFGFEAFLGIAKPFLNLKSGWPRTAVPTNSLRSTDVGCQPRRSNAAHLQTSKSARRRCSLLRLLCAGSRLSRGPGSRSAFPRCQQCHEHVAFHPRHRFDLPLIANFREQAVHLGAAHLLVRHLAATMKNHGAHLVAITEKTDDLILANLIIVLRGVRPKLDFLQLRTAAALALFVSLLVQLVLIFPVIGNFTNRRVSGRRNLYQIEPPFPRDLHGLERLHDAELRTLFVNHPDFTRSDALVYARAVIRPKVAFRYKSPSRAIGTCFPRFDQELAPKCTNINPRMRPGRGRVTKYSMADALGCNRTKAPRRLTGDGEPAFGTGGGGIKIGVV